MIEIILVGMAAAAIILAGRMMFGDRASRPDNRSGQGAREAHMVPPHQDKDFYHVPHLLTIIITFGVWLPVWLARWTMHKIDRTREAVYDIELQLYDIGLQLEDVQTLLTSDGPSRAPPTPPTRSPSPPRRRR